MDSMQEEYYNRMQREKEIDDYEITPANSVYITGNGVFIAEPVGDGTYVKRRYDREKGEAYGESMPFDKREFVYAKEIEYNSSNVSAEREAEMYEEAQASKDAQNRANLLNTRNSKLLKQLSDTNKRLQRAKDKSERKGNTKSGNSAKRRADEL
jgi:predicted neutral ceramidase superfamily lipid hydrolase